VAGLVLTFHSASPAVYSENVSIPPPDSIKANTYTTILLPTGDEKQFRDIVETLQLTERQEAVAKDLDVGEAIVQVGNRDPAPVDLDHVDVEKNIFDSLLRGLQADAWSMLPYSPRQTTQAFQQRVGNDHDESESPESEDPGTKTTDPETPAELSDDAITLLTDVVEHRFKSLNERYELFANDYKANQIKNELVDAGIVTEKTLTQGKERHKLLELTDKGRDYIEAKLEREIDHQGRGGIVHRYWQHQIRDVFQMAGWTTKIELFDADVYVLMDDKELAVEVAMEANDREVQHAKQRLDRGLDEVWVVCPNKTVSSELAEKWRRKDFQWNGSGLDGLETLGTQRFSIRSV